MDENKNVKKAPPGNLPAPAWEGHDKIYGKLLVNKTAQTEDGNSGIVVHAGETFRNCSSGMYDPVRKIGRYSLHGGADYFFTFDDSEVTWDMRKRVPNIAKDPSTELRQSDVPNDGPPRYAAFQNYALGKIVRLTPYFRTEDGCTGYLVDNGLITTLKPVAISNWMDQLNAERSVQPVLTGVSISLDGFPYMMADSVIGMTALDQTEHGEFERRYGHIYGTGWVQTTFRVRLGGDTAEVVEPVQTTDDPAYVELLHESYAAMCTEDDDNRTNTGAMIEGAGDRHHVQQAALYRELEAGRAQPEWSGPTLDADAADFMRDIYRLDAYGLHADLLPALRHVCEEERTERAGMHEIAQALVSVYKRKGVASDEESR